MSHEVNTINAEEVADYMERYQNTTGGRALEFAWQNRRSDPNGLRTVMADLRQNDFIREYEPVLDAYQASHPKSNAKRGFNLDEQPF